MAALLPDRLAGALAYRNALKDKDRTDFDGADCCALEPGNSSARAALADAASPHPEWTKAKDAKVGDRVAYGGRVLAEIAGMGKVYDWRNTSWYQPNGGHINLLGFVDHIPVIPNMPGIADFIRLRDVLYAQGLRVQGSTDSSGNVALFTDLDRLCYQARGANSYSCGFEHMHYLTTEPWTEHQLRAVAYTHWRAFKYQGIPNRRARLAPGDGLARFLTKGYTTHKDVSHYAGYNDRSDPGPLLEQDYDKVEAGVRYFDKHHNFKGF